MKRKFARREALGLTKAEFAILKRISTPEKIQNFLTALPANHEPHGDTSRSVREVLRKKEAHCIEGAMLAACALWVHGEPPLLMDLRAVRDYDHVLVLFRRDGCWGAISKSNNVMLRYRDPVYRTLRELAMSYFHEYVKKGRKTLRAYSRAFDLRTVDPKLWVTNEKNCWKIAEMLDSVRHYPVVTKRQVCLLRPRDAMERKVASIVEYPPPRKRARRSSISPRRAGRTSR